MGRRDDYDAYVEHPRFGRGPRITGFNPETNYDVAPGQPLVKLHWHSPPDRRIANTAVKADVSKQIFTTLPVTHYFDSKRTCYRCQRPFIFFAEEQKHWYEELGFSIEVDCDRCVPCRKKDQGIARRRRRYEELFHVAHPSDEELLEMAECCLSLIEASIFSPQKEERVRMLLNRAGDHAAKRKLRDRLKKLPKAKP
jgi:hypothetical protein